MTTHYLDICLRPDPDFPAGQLMGALFSKLHRRLVTLDTDNIGISFPAHSLRPRAIGSHLRMHGSTADLDAVMATRWLGGMREHADIGSVAKVPENSSHRTVSRRQFKTNVERLRRRRMRRHGETEEQVMVNIPDQVEQKVSLPFVQIRSASSNQRFSMFIEHGPEQQQAVPGYFNSYGLSPEATIPWF